MKFATQAVRSATKTTAEQEHSEPIFLTSSFVFKNAEQAERRFNKKEPGNIYSRFTNPTVETLQQRLAALEGGEKSVTTASGMAAIFAVLMTHLKPGERIVASKNMFGSTIVMLKDIVAKFGIDVHFVDLTDLNGWKNGCRKNTRMLLLETPSNPLNESVDLRILAKIAQAAGALLVVDNCLLTPVLQKPLGLGADIVIHSTTKYIDGQGRCLGGAVIGAEKYMKDIDNFVRTTGPSLSPFNAWVALKGLETLPLRMRAHSENAGKLALWLDNQKSVLKVHYPGLTTHPHHNLAKSQQSGFGGVISFEIKGGKAAAFALINATKMLSITANFGDTRTTITHPATTTHARLSAAEKAKMGIGGGLVRVSVGLEDIEDIKKDIKNGLSLSV